jgi:hypothetical protein
MERVHNVDKFRLVYPTHHLANAEPTENAICLWVSLELGSRYVSKDRNCLSRSKSEKYYFAELLVISISY